MEIVIMEYRDSSMEIVALSMEKIVHRSKRFRE